MAGFLTNNSAYRPAGNGQFPIWAAAGEPRPFPQFDGPTVQTERFHQAAIRVSRPLRLEVIRDRAGHAVCAVLGHAFTLEGGRRLSAEDFEFRAGDDLIEAEFEALYGGLFGSFILVVRIDAQVRVYLDANGSMSAVYDPQAGVVGSSAFVLFGADEYEDRRDHDLYRRLDVGFQGWFPSGLTAHRGVRRLLCNHYLELAGCTARRHWPLAFVPRHESAEPLLERIDRDTTRAIAILRRHFDCAMALTGGNDSRIIAALLEGGEPLRSYIVKVRGGARDRYLARALARRIPTRHHEMEIVQSSPAEFETWHLRAGHAIGGANATLYRTIAELGGYEAVIAGFGGEVARGFLWRAADTPESRITARSLIHRLGLPVVPELEQATEEWLAGVPEGDALFVLDLAYVELRMSAWAYAQAYVEDALLHFSPMISRSTYHAMFQLPVEYKRRNQLTYDLIARRRPDLLEVPINRYGDWRDQVPDLSRVLDPRLWVKRLRKRYLR